MGKSKSIAELEQNEDLYRDYLTKLQDVLEKRAQTQIDTMLKQANDYYQTNGWEYKEFINGKNVDFLQRSEWSLDNVKHIIDAIAKSVFGGGGGNLPDGVTVQSVEELGASLAEMANLELYIAGRAFELISGIVESFGSSSSVSFNGSTRSTPLGNGFHLFASVVCDSYKSKSFFKDEEIYEYLYVYEIRFSEGEAKEQAQIGLTKLYEDQIATFELKTEDLLKQLEEDAITPEQYHTTSSIYQDLINGSRDLLAAL